MQPSNYNSFREIRLMAGIVGFVILFLHLYYYCYGAFVAWNFSPVFLDRITANLAHSGMFNHRATSKLIAFFAFALTLIGSHAAGQIPSRKKLLWIIPCGATLYLASDLILNISMDARMATIIYIVVMASGLSLLYSSAKTLVGLLYWRFSSDIFNRFNESFPQEERLLKNPYSINIKARYTFRNQVRDSYINLIDVFRGTLVMGVPGSGKTRYVIRQMIQQSLENGMMLFVFDLKYDSLTRLTYNTLEKVRSTLKIQPKFYCVNFDDLNRSHRCNPLDPHNMTDISDANEAARTLLYAINKKWIHMQGEFFPDSAVSFVSAAIWFLKQYQNGKFCTLPHLIELIQADFYKLFSVLRSYPDLQTLVGTFISALNDGTLDQLQGQVATARIALAGLSSPQIYYLLSGNDFTLDLNNPKDPKVICIGSNPQKQFVYGAVISLYVSRMLKLVNKAGCLPCHLFFDEFSSFYCHGIHVTLAQARENKVAVTMGIQDLSQLRMEYGRDHADALFNLPANRLSSQVSGDSARLMSEQFGKILQQKSTVSVNSRDSSTSQSLSLDLSVPPSKISSLSSGEFVGITADTPSQPIQLKGVHARILVDNAALAKEQAGYVANPEVRSITRANVEFTYQQIKKEVLDLLDDRLAYMMSKPELAALIITKQGGNNRLKKSI